MTYDQLRSKFYLLTETNTSFSNANLNLYTQPAEDRVAQIILKQDASWQFDDSNRLTLPIGTQSLVSAQQDYSLPTTILTLDRVEVKDASGNWHRLSQIDQQRKKGDQNFALAAYKSTNGLPEEYDIVGNSVFLYPAPNYSQDASLKFYYSRVPLKYDYAANTNAGQFTDGSGSGATTDAPGFNPLFHDLIAYLAAFDYAIKSGMKEANGYLVKVQRMEADLEQFYGQRNRDVRRRMTTSTDSNK